MNATNATAMINCNTSSLSVTHVDRLLVTDQVLGYFYLINTYTLGQFVTITGLISNILNIAVFHKQGLQDTVNISLMSLTISDFGSLVFLFFLNVFQNPVIRKLDLSFYPQHLNYFLFYGHLIFTRITTGTTAWIAFERCLCIAAPLKIKLIITPRLTVSLISILYFVVCSSIAPMFYTSRFSWIFDSGRNRSVLGVVKIADRDKIERVVFLLNNVQPMTFFIIIVVCTVVLAKMLHTNAKWRARKVSVTKASTSSNRDTKVIKMVLIISVVFIICYLPTAVLFIGVIIYPDIKVDGEQKNLSLAVFSLLIHLEAINASSNIFIYLKMSSKFKATLKDVLCAQNKHYPDN